MSRLYVGRLVIVTSPTILLFHIQKSFFPPNEQTVALWELLILYEPKFYDAITARFFWRKLKEYIEPLGPWEGG